MIKKPTGYDEAATYTGSSSTAERKVCVRDQTVCDRSPRTETSSLPILYDIAEGDQKGFYQKMFDNDKSQNPSRSEVAACLNRTWKARDFPGLRVLLPQSNVQTTLHSSEDRTTRKR